MSCLIKVKYLNENTKTAGGSNVFEQSVVLTITEFNHLKTNWIDDFPIVQDDTSDIHEYMDSQKEFNREYIVLLKRKPRDTVLKKIIHFGNPSDSRGRTMANALADEGYKFTMEELLFLGNPANGNTFSVAYCMALLNHNFTVDEILALGNPETDGGHTIGHAMALNGHKFTIDEIFKLGNPRNKRGNTIANAMAAGGYIFTEDEVEKLGNPINNYGQDLFEYTIIYNSKLSSKQEKMLKSKSKTIKP